MLREREHVAPVQRFIQNNRRKPCEEIDSSTRSTAGTHAPTS
jgi:hypothetical protein